MELQMNAHQFFGTTPGRILMLNNFDPMALRVNSLLRYDEWKKIDEAAIDTARIKLGIVNRIVGAGLVHNLGGLGVMLSEYERIGDFTAAEQSMSSLTSAEYDTPSYDLKAVPVPLTMKPFYVELRRLQSSRMRGESIDVTGARLAAKVVAEKLEDTLVNGSTVKMGGYTAYGLSNFPDRITGSVTANWATASTTGANILADTLAMIAAANAKNYFGPFELFISVGADQRLNDDFKANSDLTIRQRLLEIPSIGAITASAKVTGSSVFLVQLTSDVIDLAVGQDVTTVEWSERGGLAQQYMVFAAMAPRLKSDKASQSGIVHYS